MLSDPFERQKAFDEFARVLKKDGLVVISEFTKNKKEKLLDHVTDFYMNKILPTLGGIISKNNKDILTIQSSSVFV